MTEADWLAGTDPFALYEFLRGETVNYKTRWQGWMTARRFPVSERKLRLFICACCARVADLLPTAEARQLLAKAEDHADGRIGEAELAQAERACEAVAARQGGSGSQWLAHEREAVAAVRLAARTEAGGRLGALPAAVRARAGAAVWRRHVEALGGVLRVRPGEFAPLESVVRTCDRPFLAAQRNAEAARQADLLRDIIGNPFRPASADPAWLTWNGGLLARMARAIYEDHRFADLPILADALEDAGCTDAEFLAHCRGGGTHARGCWVVDQLLGKV